MKETMLTGNMPLREMLNTLVKNGVPKSDAAMLASVIKSKWRRISDKAFVITPFSKKYKLEECIDAAPMYSKLIEEKTGFVAIAPFSWIFGNTDFGRNEELRAALNYSVEMLMSCKALFICGNSIPQEMHGLVAVALKMNIPIRAFNSSLLPLLRHIAIENNAETSNNIKIVDLPALGRSPEKINRLSETAGRKTAESTKGSIFSKIPFLRKSNSKEKAALKIIAEEFRSF